MLIKACVKIIIVISYNTAGYRYGHAENIDEDIKLVLHQAS
jgi:hypothetical protein